MFSGNLDREKCNTIDVYCSKQLWSFVVRTISYVLFWVINGKNGRKLRGVVGVGKGSTSNVQSRPKSIQYLGCNAITTGCPGRRRFDHEAEARGILI